MSIPLHLLDPDPEPDPPECIEGHGFMDYEFVGDYFYCAVQGCDQKVYPEEQSFDDQGENE